MFGSLKPTRLYLLCSFVASLVLPNATSASIFTSSEVEKEDHNDNLYSGGVSIKKLVKELKRKKSRGSKTMSASEQKIYSDRGDIQVLADFYRNNDVPDSMDKNQTASATSRAGVYDVVIIGAGWAGISAAMTLLSKGITNFKILEASDYIGGRSRTVYESFNGEEIPIDLGSMWLHGGVDNPLYDIVTQVGGIPTRESTFSERVYKKNNGGALTNQQLTSHYYQLYENGFMDYQARRQESTNNDEALQISKNKYLNTLSSTEKKDMTKYFTTAYIELEYSGLLTEMSLWWWDMDEYIGSADDLFLPEGYSPLIEGYAAPVLNKIETGAEVTKVNYKTSNQNVKVIYTKDGSRSVLNTKKVIVTVSLGVLKADTIQFLPKLPKNRRNSIAKLGMGEMNKIFLFWNPNDVFWPSNIEIFGDAVNRDIKFQFFNPSAYNGGKPMLFAFFSGSDVKSMETQNGYEEEITSLAMVVLRNMFGNGVKDPEKTVVTKWITDPYTMGAYSFNGVGMAKKARKILKRPIKNNRLYISGEATNYKYFQTTHGAYLAGKAAATKAAASLSRRRDDE
mmetsp:Transcript_19901/g.23049  ORF Transcript_19901/g.23049 Transcript_19901/m.23049 type:complete len:566 (+) Transcript_19901:254-1951(+)